MSLFSNLHTASSGLAVAGTSMTVIGDNIANVNTIGYKRGRASFADSFPVAVSYVHSPISIGTGAYVGGTSQIFSQGAIKVSNNNLDMAISGNGFFAVREVENHGIYYSRNGEFMLRRHSLDQRKLLSLKFNLVARRQVAQCYQNIIFWMNLQIRQFLLFHFDFIGMASVLPVVLLSHPFSFTFAASFTFSVSFAFCGSGFVCSKR